MKSLIAAAFFLASDAHEETSLMQGLMSRQNKLQKDAKESRQETTAKLMETATKMMKNGATPDVITFIETTITEVNSDVLGVIVDEHNRDQELINSLLRRFDAAIAEMEACAAEVAQQHLDRQEKSLDHQWCRSDEAIKCGRSRRCEEELEELWTIVKIEEEEMRRIHWAIHGEWCVGPAPPHPNLGDPWAWTLEESWEGPETSQSTDPYPVVDYTADVIEFRRFSVEYFGLYIAQKPRVELAWTNYNAKLIECAALEETWELKVEECDAAQDAMHAQACMHASSSRQCVSTFGHEYHMTMVAYTNAVATIRVLEYERKREWETLHIVTCLLETVYTHVIHSIDSGEPCPTIETHEEQTAAEINYCHVVEESLTTNLTIDYGEVPPPPGLPDPEPYPCTDEYIVAETGSFPITLQSSHSATIQAEGLEAYFTVLSAFGWAGCAAPKACIPCDTPDLIIDPDYTECSTCMAHQEHLRPGQLDMDTFKCLSGDECIRASGRCNGQGQCSDGSDELGCGTWWGQPAVLGTQECTGNDDVEFQCADNSCTHIMGRCNGVNNCADGSDEQGCATTTTGVQLEAFSGYTATIETPALNSEVFYDRTYTFDSLGSFTGHSFLKMSNEDKHIRHSHVQMRVRLPQPMIMYVSKLDDTELPWLAAEGWTLTDLTGVSYHGVRQTRHTDWSGELNEDHYRAGAVYQKFYTAGIADIRGNNGGDGSYVMFVSTASGAPQPDQLWDQHLGLWSGQSATDRVKCNNNVDMIYVPDQATCQAHAEANGHHFYSFRHNGENSGHKCMSSSHCDEENGLLDDRTNEWYVYISPNYVDTSCPSGWTQVGEAGADIGGCGLQSCGERYWSNNPSECAASCAVRSDCQGFNWAPLGGDRNHEAMTVCTIYNAAAPTSTWYGSAGYVQIFCAANTPTLQNGNFEQLSISSNSHGGQYEYTSNIAGWTAAGGTVIALSGNAPWGSVNSGGSYYMCLQANAASLTQAVAGHVVGRQYTLRVSAAQRQNSPGGRNAILTITANGAQLMNEVVQSATFQVFTFTYTADAEVMNIRLENTVASGDQTVFVDDISIA